MLQPLIRCCHCRHRREYLPPRAPSSGSYSHHAANVCAEFHINVAQMTAQDSLNAERACLQCIPPLRLPPTCSAAMLVARDELGSTVGSASRLPEMAPLQCARSLDFWLLFLVFGIGAGCGLLFINNVGARL